MPPILPWYQQNMDSFKCLTWFSCGNTPNKLSARLNEYDKFPRNDFRTENFHKNMTSNWLNICRLHIDTDSICDDLLVTSSKNRNCYQPFIAIIINYITICDRRNMTDAKFVSSIRFVHLISVGFLRSFFLSGSLFWVETISKNSRRCKPSRKNSKSLGHSLFSALFFLRAFGSNVPFYSFFFRLRTWNARFHDIFDIKHFRIRHNPDRMRLQSRSFRKRLTYGKNKGSGRTSIEINDFLPMEFPWQSAVRNCL